MAFWGLYRPLESSRLDSGSFWSLGVIGGRVGCEPEVRVTTMGAHATLLGSRIFKDTEALKCISQMGKLRSGVTRQCI